MEKPVKKSLLPHMLKYSEVIAYIEVKYKIKVQDYAGLFQSTKGLTHFEVYQKKMKDPMPFGNNNYPDLSGFHHGFDTEYTVIRNKKRVPSTKEEYDTDMALIHAQYQRYKVWTRDNPQPAYLNYWHWLLDSCFTEPVNNTEQVINVLEILEEKKTPVWVKEITQLIYDEFKDELDDDGVLTVWVSW